MGQLEVYNINETIVSGLMLAIFITYIAEALESSTFESFKGYKYSANFASNKIRKALISSTVIFTTSNPDFNLPVYVVSSEDTNYQNNLTSYLFSMSESIITNIDVIMLYMSIILNILVG
jgi:methionine salvage enolase-phosphatase E1